MIRFVSTETRGGDLTVTLNPFDLLSLIEGLTAGANHFSHRAKEYEDETGVGNEAQEEIHGYLKGHEKDCLDNIKELMKVQQDREDVFNAERQQEA